MAKLEETKERLPSLLLVVDFDEFDEHTFAWLHELKEKAIEMGKVAEFKLVNLPRELDLK